MIKELVETITNKIVNNIPSEAIELIENITDTDLRFQVIKELKSKVSEVMPLAAMDYLMYYIVSIKIIFIIV